MLDIQWLIGGEAGYGIMTTGIMMAKIMARLGLSVFDYVEYPSLIRGGHNAYYVRGADHKIYSQKRPVDILVALNRDTITRHIHELSDHAAVLYDPNVTKIEDGEFPEYVHLMPVPFLEITKQVGSDRLMINTVAVGASLALFSPSYDVLEKILHDAFGRKGEHVVQENINTSKAGFDYVNTHYAGKFAHIVEPSEQKSFLIGGAEAVAFGAIRAGVKFAAIYPMTPINGIMTTLTAHALKYNIVTKEPEDEIAGINMAIGAGFGGVRSMVATAGGGFSLMVEAFSLAAQAEVPLVVVEGMRPGPATGMPTWTTQGDLRFVLHAAQDDFPRIVIAPGDVEEAFAYTMLAFNMAEKYQTAVILLVDKYLMEGHGTVDVSRMQEDNKGFRLERGKVLSDESLVNETDYKRYAFTDDGISPRSIPGQQGGIALSGSDEHDERGLYNEEGENRAKMMEKRFKKLTAAYADMLAPNRYGDEDAPLTIVGFGSTKFTALEAIEWLKRENISVNYISVPFLSPFPSDALQAMLEKTHKTLVVEGNYTGQFEGLIREKTGVVPTDRLHKYDGRPFYPEEIVEKVKSML